MSGTSVAVPFPSTAIVGVVSVVWAAAGAASSSVAASAAKSVLMFQLRSRRERVTLVVPPAAPALDVFARRLAEMGRADDEDLEALRPGLVPPPRAGRDADRVPRL